MMDNREEEKNYPLFSSSANPTASQNNNLPMHQNGGGLTPAMFSQNGGFASPAAISEYRLQNDGFRSPASTLTWPDNSLSVQQQQQQNGTGFPTFNPPVNRPLPLQQNGGFPTPADQFLPEQGLGGGRPDQNLPFTLSHPEIMNRYAFPDHINPSCYNIDTLEADFGRMMMITSRQSPSPVRSFCGGRVVNGLDYDLINNNLYHHSANADLQSLRVQSAVRGQNRHLGYYDDELEAFGLIPSSFDDDNYYVHNINGGGGRRNCSNATSCRPVRLNNRNNGFRSGTDAYRNGGIQSVYAYKNNGGGSSRNFLGRNARSNGNYRADNINPSTGLLSSLYNISGAANGGANNHRSEEEQDSDLSLFKDEVSLEELRGKILMAAKDRVGCPILQNKLNEGKAEAVELIYMELKDHVRELMVDQYGNYLVQGLFRLCNAEWITQMLVLLLSDERHLFDICCDMHGTRAMQKLVEYLTTKEQRTKLVAVLRSITVRLIKSPNGHHVIQHCLRLFSLEDIWPILHVAANNCLDIAMDQSGCCVMQHCVQCAEGESRDRLLHEIAANALVLSEHRFGNYVVQFVLGLKIPDVTRDILAMLGGSFVTLSMNKYGSNVVEKCLREPTEDDQVSRIVTEIINSPKFLTLCQDAFGNYVAQSAYAVSKGSLQHTMGNLIQLHRQSLHSHPYGKRVLMLVTQNKGGNKLRAHN